MQITITRQTGVVGISMALTVYINDVKVGTLKNGETATYTTNEPECSVRVAQAYVTSKPVTLTKDTKLVAKASLFGVFFSFLARKAFYLEEVQ